jgi:hypothetical protein
MRVASCSPAHVKNQSVRGPTRTRPVMLGTGRVSIRTEFAFPREHLGNKLAIELGFPNRELEEYQHESGST